MKRSSCFWTRKTQWAFLSPCQKFRNSSILKQKHISVLMNILPIVNNCKILIFQKDQNNFDVKSKFFKREHRLSTNTTFWDHQLSRIQYFYWTISRNVLTNNLLTLKKIGKLFGDPTLLAKSNTFLKKNIVSS